MGKLILAAALGISVIGGFVALEAQQRTLSPEEQIERYRANERAREIAHLGFLECQKHIRRQFAGGKAPFRELVTGHSPGGMYECAISVTGDDERTVALDIVGTCSDATHEIHATLAAQLDSQFARQEFQEWYTARRDFRN
jgi:hypothetical protein